MINDLAWRKVPRNIIRDENIDYIASLMPQHLQALPMLLYFVMYCKADDEGMVDLRDGVIYSRLLKIGTPGDILNVAILMTGQNLLVQPVDGVNVFIITDWEVPPRPGQKASRTMGERRAAIAQKIIEEQKRAKIIEERKAEMARLKNAQNAFFCPENDRKRDFVDKERETDRESIYRDREFKEIETQKEFRDREKDTHTEGCYRGNNKFPLPQPQENVQEQNPEINTEPLEATEQEIESLAHLAFEVVNSDNKAEEVKENSPKEIVASSDIDEVYVVFFNFFSKNCLDFNESKYQAAMLELAGLMKMLESQANPAKNIASVFCQEFKKLTESKNGYYQNYPLNPQALLKPGAYKTVLSMASRILCFKNESNINWIKQSKALEENRAVYDDYKSMFVQYGIDPNSENALMNLIRKKESAIK